MVQGHVYTLRFTLRLAAGALWLAALLLFPGAGMASGEASAPADSRLGRNRAEEGSHELRCTILDAATGDTLFARCQVKGSDGLNYVPILGGFYHAGNGGYFYSNGTFDVPVPNGRTIVRVGRGFEYAESGDTLAVHSDTSIVVKLSRVVDMGALGWYSGDCHVHINHEGGNYTLSPADVLFISRGEGLNVANCLDNGYYFTGAPASCSTADCIVYLSEEYRTNGEGHLGLIGLTSLVTPADGVWWPMDSNVAARAHAAGGLAISAHPGSSLDFWQVKSWPGNGIARELPIDVIGGAIDAMDVMSYSNCRPSGIETPLWYHILNCGFKLPASAGTDAAVDRQGDLPPGGCRVFVLVSGGSFTYGSWLEGLAKGRTVVTNGPLITHFDIADRMPGDSLAYAHGSNVASGEISVRSVHPVGRIEIVQNGVPVRTIVLTGASRTSVDTTFTVPIDKSCWVAARVLGKGTGWVTIGDTLFAHTSPVYFKVAGERVVEKGDAQYLLAWVTDLRTLGSMKGEWPEPGDSVGFLAACDAAREYYNRLILGPTSDAGSGGGGSNGAPPAIRCANAPNPFSRSTSLTFTVPNGSGAVGRGGGAASAATGTVRLTIYDVSGRVVRRLVQKSLPGGSYTVSWDGRDESGVRVASGIYFARVSAGAQAVTRKMLLVR